MSYTVPGLSIAVVLTADYTVPPLSAGVVLGKDTTNAIARVPVPAPVPVVVPVGVAELVSLARAAERLQAPTAPAIVRAAADPYMPLSYAPPAIGVPVILPAAYSIPPLAAPVVLVGVSATTVDVVMVAALVPVAPDFDVSARAVIGLPALGEALLPPEVPAVALMATAAQMLPVRIVVTLAAPLPLIDLEAGAVQDVVLHDADGVRAAAPHRHGLPAEAGSAIAQQSMQAARVAGAVPHTHGVACIAGSRAAHASAQALRRTARQRHQHGMSLTHGSSSRQSSTQPLRRPARVPHAHALPLCRGAAARQTSTLRPGHLLQASHQQARPISKGQSAGHHQARPTATRIRLRWQHGDLPLPGRWWPLYEPPGLVVVLDASTYIPRPLHCRVVLGAGYAIQPPCDYNPPEQPGHIIPIRRTYIVLNEVSLRRTDSSTEVQALSLDISIDADSWLPSWSAEVAFSEWPSLAAENGQPLELEAIVNGHRWLLLAEGAPVRSRTFGKTSVRLRGRGIAAWLDATYAGESTHYNASQMTAQQLMGQALTTNGVGIGWDIDWRISDWLVPAGAWSLQGGAIDGVLNVAEAVSAIVQADPVEKILKVMPRYPAVPWNWGSLTPDIEIPLDIIMSDSVEPIVRPDYNAIYVSGQTQGAWARVSRAGTAKDKLAPMITHPLLTAEQALRQRGLSELGNTGRQARVTISLPISDDTTLLQVGQLAAMSESADPWRGLIRSVSVSARWQDGAGLTVNQSAELERHYA